MTAAQSTDPGTARDPAQARLPALRRDLEIGPGSTDVTGAPTWLIHDPLQRRYFQIDAQTHELVQLWRAGMTLAEFAEAAEQRLGTPVGWQQVGRVVDFVRGANLSVEEAPGQWRMLAKRANTSRQSVPMRIAHSYLFFKVPLCRPQHLLAATLPFVAPLFTRTAGYLIATAGIAGLYLVSQQWDAFVGSFHNALSWEGAATLAVALLVIKSLHELGHALTAARFGCRVPTMGVAFMLMMPMLYTDVSDAWRLTSRRQRLAIHGAGIVVELSLACIATLLWAFMPDGAMRGLVFVVASTSWIMTLALNLNPFMRFDGYYLLAEATGVDNLQTRAFALGVWQVRRLLLAPALPPPEILPPRTAAWLVAFAWGTWAYRLVTFTAIAVVVYHLFFKLLGIVLFAVEIWFFIAKPIVKEIAMWPKMAPGSYARGRIAATAGGGLLLLAVLIAPWSTSIEVPALLEAADVARVYPPRPAWIVSTQVRRGAQIEKGAVIAHLEVPELDNEIAATEIKLELNRLRLARTATNRDDRSETIVLTHENASLQTRLAGLHEQKAELVVRAPISGLVMEVDPNLHAGRWLAKNEMLVLIAPHDRHVARGYATAAQLARIGLGSEGRFIPDDLTRGSLRVRLTGIARAGATSIDLPELASTNGGRIGVDTDAQQAQTPVVAQYLVEMQPEVMTAPLVQTTRGVVRLSGEAESLAISAWRQVARVLIRESGF